MFFCEECRVKNGWPKNIGWPFMGMSFGQCEVCRKSNVECHDVPSSDLRPEDRKSALEKSLDLARQTEYRLKSESMVITNLSGLIDHSQTNLLRQAFVLRNGKVDWPTTYEIRLKIQQGHRLEEQSKRDRR